MKRVIGLGGVFFKSKDPKALGEWYARHLGIVPDPRKGAGFPWRRDDEPERSERTVWAPFSADTGYFAPSTAPFMFNYIVEDLDALLEALEAEGVTVDEKREDHPYGRFAWAMDPEGNRIELWEPVKKT